MDRKEDNEQHEAKISPVFAARLKRLKPKEKVRVIVMLDTGEPTRDLKKRPTKTARQVVLKKTREHVKEILPDIDRVLRQHHGKRLKSEIDGLSAVPVITTAAGVNALISSQHVKAIIEDQALFRVA